MPKYGFRFHFMSLFYLPWRKSQFNVLSNPTFNPLGHKHCFPTVSLKQILIQCLFFYPLLLISLLLYYIISVWITNQSMSSHTTCCTIVSNFLFMHFWVNFFKFMINILSNATNGYCQQANCINSNHLAKFIVTGTIVIILWNIIQNKNRANMCNKICDKSTLKITNLWNGSKICIF